MGLTYEEVEVTPQVAQQWLDTMARNRHLSELTKDTYVRDMKNGRWHQDGAPIRFNDEGHLIDGQHRLSAVVEAGIPQEFLVIRGVHNSAMTTMDTGKTRSKADVLAIHDPTLPNVIALSAVAAAHARWTNDVRGPSLRNSPVPNDELIEHVDAYRELLVEATRVGKRVSSYYPGFTAQAFGVADALFQALDMEDRDYFWERLLDGAGLEPGDPIYALREFLIRESKTNAAHRPRVRVEVGLAIITKAWNAYREGREVRLLTFKSGGARPEAFPEPI